METRANHEDSAVRAMSALREMEADRLAREAEAAVARLEAARDGGDAVAENELRRLAAEAERLVEAYEAATAVRRPEVWPMSTASHDVVVPPEMPAPSLEPMPEPPLELRRRRPWVAAVMLLGAAGVLAGAIVLFQRSAPARASTEADAPTERAPAPAAVPDEDPELTPAERARLEWESRQVREAAERLERRHRDRPRRARQGKPDLDKKVKVDCDPHDPLCGVD